MGITPEEFELLQARIKNSSASVEEIVPQSNPSHQILLGIDPSLRGTGYGIIRIEQNLGRRYPVFLVAGTIKCESTLSHSACCVKIGQTIRKAIQEYSPTVCVVEGLFYVHNLRTAIVMGEARGAGLLVAAENGLEIYEMAPRRVKQAIVGYGAAQKLAVAKMVQRMLNLQELPAPDAADALALALAYFQESGKPVFSPLKKI